MTTIDSWTTISIEKCCDILDAKRVPVNAGDRQNRVGAIPYYGANGLQGYIDDFLFDEPLILIAEDGGRFDEFTTCPIAYRIQGKTWVNNHAHVLRAKHDFNQDFVFYSLEHKDIQHFIVGGTRTKLNQSALRNITIGVPKSRNEQSKIAHILSLVDRAIEQTEALIAKQQQIKVGLMQDLLTRGIDEQGNLRSEKTHQFKDSPLGRIPVEWEVTELSKLATVNRGKFTHRPRNDPNYYGGEFPFIQTGDVTSHIGRKLISYSQTLNENGIKVSMLFPANTIAITIAANIADTAILGLPMFFPDSVVGAMVYNPNDVRFIELMIRQRKPLLERQATQSAQKNINLEVLRPMKISTPPPSEQKRIGACYENHELNQKRMEAQLMKLRSLKIALMQDLLTGRKRVTVPLPSGSSIPDGTNTGTGY